jgi:hypothetical protein
MAKVLVMLVLTLRCKSRQVDVCGELNFFSLKDNVMVELANEQRPSPQPTNESNVYLHLF